MKELEDLYQLFAETGGPSAESQRKLQALQENCMARMDPDSFYVTVDVTKGFTYPWTHNMESALGQKVDNLDDLWQLVHPSWRAVHRVYSEALLRLIVFQRNFPLNDEMVFSTEIPFSVKGGGYRWFKQTTTAGAASATGGLISYHSQYYVLGNFTTLIPDFPLITLRGKPGRRVNQAFRFAVNKLFPRVLKQHFSPANQKIVSAYREQSTWNGSSWEVPIKADMAAIIGMKPVALDRAISRLLKTAREVFPEHTAGNIANFINLMNTLFPKRVIE
ncbi:MAG: hypothetical protein AAF597_03265 [Bacteroidota bacterium]